MMIKRLRAPAIVRVAVLCTVAAIGLLATVSGARAQGTVMIQRHGVDSTDSYARVKIQLLHNTLNITSEDGKGTLIITRAACAYHGQVIACLPTDATLVQSGGVHALDLKSGTIYVNLTDTTQQLSHSSTQLPPQGVIMSLKTVKGTYVNMTGTLDKVLK
jgi:hypothetical protein